MKKYILPTFQNATQSVRFLFLNDSKQRRVALSYLSKTIKIIERINIKT